MVELKKEVKVRSFKLDAPNLLKRAARYEASSISKRINRMKEPENSPLTKKVKGSSGVLKDTGLLMASITPRMIGENIATVGTNRLGAKTANYGATIRPVKAKALYIPANRVARLETNTYGSVSRAIKSLRSKGYSIYKSKGGRSLLGYKKGSNKKPEVFFIIKSEVTILARPFMYFSNSDQEEIRKIMKGEVLNET